MANDDDEFGFKSLAESFKPEVKKEEAQAAKAAKVAPPAMPQPVATKPVVPAVSMPALPEIKPQEVAASVPQQAVPELPPIQNPVFNPEFQKAAAVASLPAVLGGAALGAGAAYGLYKGRKSIQDRSIGKPMNAPADFGGNLGKQLEGMDMSRVSQSDLQLLQKAEANRIAKQSAAQAEINKLPGFTPPGTPTPAAPVAANPVPAQTPPTIQAQIQTPTQNRIPSMMATQEMNNPLGGQASAYTEPLRPPPTVAEMGQQSAGAITTEAKAPAAAIPPATEEKNKGGATKGAKRLPANIKDTPETWQKFTKEGLTFLPGYGPGDNNLYNTYGAEGRRAILEKYNQGKPIGDYENYLKLNEKLKKGVPASEVPALMSRLPSEDEAGNYSKLGKAAKVAGVGGLLISAANLANAKTPGERSLAGANLLGAVIPPAANINEAGAPVLPPNILAAQQRQLEEMQKLGSPYRKR